MIKPILKDLIITGNPNIYGKLQFTETEDIGDDFYLSGTACIGTEDSNGEDFFDFTIITPKALERELRNETKIILGMRHFILNKLDFELITETINQILSKHQGETWKEVVESLSPYFLWEYTNSTHLNEDGFLEMINKHSNKES
ncbi:Imm8 family immunity protein [Paenibacillus sp. S-12]|uniref:Imm8 family immunity protein n=1 Tax=Paenibacillus sp. S-12 TaxID=3031371 RepID=UPI0025A2E50A|nr:Imm8 family immunity protein [Paenibacillus sp. S-12]